MFSRFTSIIIVIIIIVIVNIITLIVINSTNILIYLAIIPWVSLIKQYEYFSFFTAGSESRKYQSQAAALMIIVKQHALKIPSCCLRVNTD